MSDTSSNTAPSEPGSEPRTDGVRLEDLQGEATRVRRYRLGFRHAVALWVSAALALAAVGTMFPPDRAAEIAALNHEADAELAVAAAMGLEQLKVFVRNARYEGTPARAKGVHRIEALTRAMIDTAFDNVDQTNWRSVTRFLSRFGRDAYALEKGYVQELDAALAALVPDEPPMQSADLGDLLNTAEKDALDPLKLADPAALAALVREVLDSNVARVRGALADALRVPGALVVDRAFANLNRTSLKQIDAFLSAFRDNPYAQEQGYIDALERAAAEKADFASTKRIVPCGVCWCFVVDERPLTD